MRFHLKKVVRFVSLIILLFVLTQLLSYQEEVLSQINPTINKKEKTQSISAENLNNNDIINAKERSHCKELEPINPMIRERFIFQKVSSKPDYLAFSAFYSDQPGDAYFLRIIGIGRYLNNRLDKSVPYPQYCQLWFQKKDGNTVKVYNEVVPTVVQIMPEQKSKKYHPVLYLCYGPKNYKLKTVPYAVSLVDSKCKKPLNFLKVVNTKEEAKGKTQLDFGVCVTPFNFNYNKTLSFVENLEIQKMFGAQHFTFYNFSLSDKMKPVLNSYASEGNISVIPWPLPPHLKVDIWPPNKKHVPNIFYFAQLGALNDCLYRNMYRFKYLLFLDLDEIVVPRKDKTWKEMIESAAKVKGFTKNATSYMFRNTFFRLDWGLLSDDSLSDKRIQLYHPYSLLSVNREKRIWNAGSRSKYMIVDAQCVSVVGVHQIWGYISGKRCYKHKSMIMPINIGLLHHYRNWKKPEQKKHDAMIKDNNIFRFKDSIISRIEDRFKKITSQGQIEFIQ